MQHGLEHIAPEEGVLPVGDEGAGEVMDQVPMLCASKGPVTCVAGGSECR